MKVSNLLMKNDLTVPNDKLKATNIVYRYSHPTEGSTPLIPQYIGMTTTTLSRRLTMHLQDGAIKQYCNEQNKRLQRQTLVDNTTIIMKCNDKKRLEIAEALLIIEQKPLINIQSKRMGGKLKLYC